MTEGTEKKEGAGLADIAKSDFILLGAFLVFLGLISTDAYYRSFGLRFQFLSYPWNLILFRGVQTVTRFPSLLIFPILVLITLQADRPLEARISEGVRVPLFYVVALIIVFIATHRATSIGSIAQNAPVSRGSGDRRIKLDRDRRILAVGDTDIALTAIETAIMELIISSPSRIVPSGEMMSKVWDRDAPKSPSILESTLHRLRQKFRKRGVPDLIENIKGRGYRLSPPRTSESS